MQPNTIPWYDLSVYGLEFKSVRYEEDDHIKVAVGFKSTSDLGERILAHDATQSWLNDHEAKELQGWLLIDPNSLTPADLVDSLFSRAKEITVPYNTIQVDLLDRKAKLDEFLEECLQTVKSEQRKAVAANSAVAPEEEKPAANKSVQGQILNSLLAGNSINNDEVLKRNYVGKSADAEQTDAVDQDAPADTLEAPTNMENQAEVDGHAEAEAETAREEEAEQLLEGMR